MGSSSLDTRCWINRLTLGAALCVTTTLPVALRAQTGDTVSRRVLVPGVLYRHIVDKRGPLVMHVVTVNLRRPDIELRVARAHDQLKGREKTSEMVRRVAATGVRVPAAVNADFFELTSGENENEQVLRGEWWKGLKVTDSPYDTYDNVHVQFGLDAAGRPVMDRYILDGKAWDRGAMTPIVAMNFNPSGKPEGTALFTARYGTAAPRDTTRQTAEATMTAAGHRGDTLLFVRRGAVSSTSGSTIPTDGAVLAAYGARTKAVLAMAEGDTVKVLLATLPRLPHGAAPVLLIGGWPRILRDGENVAGDAATTEGTLSRNAEMVHPRTAVGFSRDSATLILLTVDGRSENSGGVTLVDLARLMRRLGAWQAMNFDGGGSTTMVIDGAVVNAPSDKTGEREVGNALMVVRRRR
ncbi:MAG: phosphodiester glycosidase family protein [Gemmatimonadaceae bacterium]